MENLNNMKKTVLKLEKEISAISNNLSKVKNKDHSTMKKIIHNINNLLSKDTQKNNIYKNENNNYINNIEKDQKTSDNNLIKKSDNIPNNNERNTDYILTPFNKNKKNDLKRKVENQQYFNRKSNSSSRINCNIISEGNNQNYSKKFFGPYKSKNNVTNENLKNANTNRNNNNNNIIDYTNNKILNKTNQMTYSKPKLKNECSKKNTKLNINSDNYNNNNNNNNITNNIFYKKSNTLTKKEIKESESITNLKYLTLNEKTNQIIKENNLTKPENIYNLYYNYNNEGEKKALFEENKNISNKLFCTYEQNGINKKDNYLNNIEYDEIGTKNNLREEYKVESQRGILLNNKKNKKIIFERKSKRNNTFNIKSNPNIRNPLSHNYNVNSTHIFNSKYTINKARNNSLLSLDEENKNKNELSDIIFNNKKRYIFDKNNSNDNIYVIHTNSTEKKNKINYITKNISHLNLEKVNFSSDEKYENTDTSEDKDKDKINKLLYMLNVTNLDDAIQKVGNLLKYEKYINKLKELYNEPHKRNNYNEQNNNLYWVSSIIKRYKKNEKYRNYCKNIMEQNEINHFNEFKNFIDNILIKNRKNTGFIIEVKNILCEDEYNSNNKNIKNLKNINKMNYEASKNIKEDINKLMNNSDNSNDIKFTQNDDNSKNINKYLLTHY